MAVIGDSLEVLRGINVPMSQACREYAEGFRLLGRQPLIVKACEHYYAAYLEKQKTMHAPVKFHAVADDFLEAMERQGRSARYREDSKSRLNKAAKAFRGYLQRITASDIDAWLDSIKAAGRTRNNYRATLCTLFGFARSRGYLSRGERHEAEMTMKAKRPRWRDWHLHPGRAFRHADRHCAEIRAVRRARRFRRVAHRGDSSPRMARHRFSRRTYHRWQAQGEDWSAKNHSGPAGLEGMARTARATPGKRSFRNIRTMRLCSARFERR
jgi:hypothetical protein